MSKEDIKQLTKSIQSIEKKLNELRNDFNKLRDSSLQSACILQTAVEQLNKRGGTNSSKATNSSTTIVKNSVSKAKKTVNIKLFFSNLVKDDKDKVINWLKKKSKSDQEPIADRAKEALNLFNKIHEEQTQKWASKKSEKEILKKTGNEFWKHTLQKKATNRFANMYSWIEELRDKAKQDDESRDVAKPK